MASVKEEKGGEKGAVESSKRQGGTTVGDKSKDGHGDTNGNGNIIGNG